MRRIRIIGCCLAAMFAVSAMAASAAQAETGDWTINGVPIKGGASLKLSVRSESNFTIVVPALAMYIECSSLTAKGTVVGGGGTEGSGTLKGKAAGCNLSGKKECPIKPKPVTWKIYPDYEISGYFDGEPIWFGTMHWWWQTNWNMEGKSKGGGCGPKGKTLYAVAGNIDSEGTTAGSGGGGEEKTLAGILFPETPRPENTLTVNGNPARATGSFSTTMRKGGVLGAAE